MSGSNATCIAPLFATVSGADAVSIGTRGATHAQSAVAVAGGSVTGIESVGIGATVSHYRSVAFPGYDPTADKQLMLGDRDAEVTIHLHGIILKSPTDSLPDEGQQRRHLEPEAL